MPFLERVIMRVGVLLSRPAAIFVIDPSIQQRRAHRRGPVGGKRQIMQRNTMMLHGKPMGDAGSGDNLPWQLSRDAA